jgi:hypothetical protein
MEDIMANVKKEKDFIQISISKSLANKLAALKKKSYNQAILGLLENNADLSVKRSINEHSERLEKIEEVLNRILLKVRL